MNNAMFATRRGRHVAEADAVNEAGGLAYKLSSKQALAQLACTGTFAGTYYATAGQQLESFLTLVKEVDPLFAAKVAIYARKSGFMKDTPAVIVAYLAVHGTPNWEKTADQVLDNGKMLRNFCQVIRSGQLGRKSFGTRIRRYIRRWLQVRPMDMLFRDSVGTKPSIGDVIRMVHPKADGETRNALFRYILGQEYRVDQLPDLAREWEAYKADRLRPLPNVPFQLVTGLQDLQDWAWKKIALNASWQTLRMNLNTFSRHGVFTDEEAVHQLANRLVDPEQIKRSQVFPYQLLQASKAVSGIPVEFRVALEKAMEIATINVPVFQGRTVVCPDVSGSMSNPVTGRRDGASSATQYVDVAALFASVILRQNKLATILPFDTRLHLSELNPFDSVMTNAQKLAEFGGGGTNCSLPMEYLVREQIKADLVIYVSDNESWADYHGGYRQRGTHMANLWEEFKQNNPRAKLVLIDIAPYDTTQNQNSEDVLNVGGFSDQVFEVINAWVNESDPDGWVKRIEDRG